MTRRDEEVRYASISAGQSFSAEPCHSGGQRSGGLDRVPKSCGLPAFISASRRYSNGGRTNAAKFIDFAGGRTG